MDNMDTKSFGKRPEKIMCQDDINVESYEKDYEEVLNDLKKNSEFIVEECGYYSEKKLKINGFQCRIVFCRDHYNGYVDVTPEQETKLDGYDDDEETYKPHGGFTASWGFDTAHAGDVYLYPNDILYVPAIKYKENEPTFKTRNYIFHELERLTKSMMKYMEKHKKKK